MLSPRQGRGAGRTEQVGPAGRSEQQRSPGEHPGHLAVGLQHVGQMRERMAGRSQDAQAGGRADVDGVAVGDRLTAEADRIRGVHQVRRARFA
jgi:hypothetical protein